MNQILIIADDLTGAADTGVQFCPFFDDTVLISYLQLSKAVVAASGVCRGAIHQQSRFGNDGRT